jgi:hypothetical protein
MQRANKLEHQNDALADASVLGSDALHCHDARITAPFWLCFSLSDSAALKMRILYFRCCRLEWGFDFSFVFVR